MVVVTDLKIQKNQKRVNLFFDGRYAFSLSLDEVVKNSLRNGQQLSSETVSNLYLKSQYEKVLTRVLNLLSYRPRSYREIVDYLEKHFYKQNVSLVLKKKLREKIFQKLEELKLINDEVFAIWWVEQRLNFRPKGKRMLKAELLQKGVDSQIVIRVLSNLNNQSLEKLAKNQAEKKLRSLKNKPFMEQKRKLFSHLQRKGFDYRIIKNIIDELLEK